jgi:hypothetical protein
MQVMVVEVPSCPNAGDVVDRLSVALELVGRPDVGVDRAVVTTVEDAVRLGAAGSPTILVNGRDLFPREASGPVRGLLCRLYPTVAGMSGAPTVEQIVDALARLEA